ncbi:MAG: diguanylate cyclase [Terracidiphilus sp.]
MIDRTQMLEAALDSLPEGIAVFGSAGEVIFWNQAAQSITGYAAIDLLTRPLPEGLQSLLFGASHDDASEPGIGPRQIHRALVQPRHKLGHGVPVITRVLVLRDPLGAHIGAAAVFHPAESLDALPHGESGSDKDVEESRADLEERLQTEFDDFTRGGAPFGVLWIAVDQAPELRGTHGVAACRAMLDKVRHTLAQGLRPAEEMGLWGDSEFLILAHERNAQMLAARAQTLAGLARTSDFRWWGDRISITVSVGAAQAAEGQTETLAQLLDRSRQAMEASIRTGGNRATAAAAANPAKPAAEESTCSPL